MSEEYKTKDEVLNLEIQYLRKDFQEYARKVDCYMEKTDNRLKLLEEWKLVFVAKFSVYSAIALFLGSIMSNLAIRWIGGLL